jgi:hypothetical protein
MCVCVNVNVCLYDSTGNTLSLHSRSHTLAGETLRWCKHEEGLMILIPHMDGSPPQRNHISERNHKSARGCSARDLNVPVRGWRRLPSLATPLGTGACLVLVGDR